MIQIEGVDLIVDTVGGIDQTFEDSIACKPGRNNKN